jgi:putative ATP-dependent endonuclease of OLD family
VRPVGFATAADGQPTCCCPFARDRDETADHSVDVLSDFRVFVDGITTVATLHGRGGRRMRVRRLKIRNFRGVSDGTVDFPQHTLLVGGGNVGKSTVCEALELVLGPERLGRRLVIEEHDFHVGRYLEADGNPVEITITAVLIEISDEARNRFHLHLRPWDEGTGEFADETGGPVTSTPVWALPVTFIGRYDRDEDDFVGNTFFEHPAPSPATPEDAQNEPFTFLGNGRTTFGREQKRYCGFVFLRALRTGSRALSLQRGSLLDTILRLGGGGLTEMWEDTLGRLRDLDPAIGDMPKLQQIRTEIQTRLSQFMNLAAVNDPTEFFASELTREHLREVVRLFVAAQPGSYSVPFNRLGTGSINLLVFALLTFIADLKGTKNVIFAMEEPEIALPPHAQRRITRFVLHEMGQSIVTSHSPYVIEQFEPNQIVLLDRTDAGNLTGRPVGIGVVKPKAFRAERRQFAEAILSRAVLVVEGATEAVVFHARNVPLVGRQTVRPRARSNSANLRGAAGDESNPSSALVCSQSAYSRALDDSVRDDSARQIPVQLVENDARPWE